MDAQPMDDEVHEPRAAAQTTDEDVEGHSVFAAIAVSGALRARAQREGQAAMTRADESLPPLTKPFPSMRPDRRR
jgi:hypothetical protein